MVKTCKNKTKYKVVAHGDRSMGMTNTENRNTYVRMLRELQLQLRDAHIRIKDLNANDSTSYVID